MRLVISARVVIIRSNVFHTHCTRSLGRACGGRALAARAWGCGVKRAAVVSLQRSGVCMQQIGMLGLSSRTEMLLSIKRIFCNQ